MYKVRINYVSSNEKNVLLTVKIKDFFRLCGIYTVENAIDDRINFDSYLLSSLSIKLKKVDYHDYDAEIYVCSNVDEYNDCVSRGVSEKMVLILNNSLEEVPDNRKDNDHTIVFEGKADINELLIMSLFPSDSSEYQDLFSILNIYNEEKIYQLYDLDKYFSMDDDKVKAMIREYFASSIMKLFDELGNIKCKWGDLKHLHLQYAILYLITRGNDFCEKIKAPFLYTPDSIKKTFKIIVNSFDTVTKNMVGESFSLLNDFIYKKDPYQGNNLNDYMAYSYVLYANKYKYSYDDSNHNLSAIQMLHQGISIDPMYYRAWNELGNRYQKLKNYKDAMKAYDNVHIILEKKLKQKILSPMELVTLLEVFQKRCFISYHYLKDASLMQEDYKYFSQLIEDDPIEGNKYLKMFYSKEEDNERLLVIKKSLYTEILNWYHKINYVMNEMYLRLGKEETFKVEKGKQEQFIQKIKEKAFKGYN